MNFGADRIYAYLMENNAVSMEKLHRKSGSVACSALPRNELFSASFLHRLSYFCRKARCLEIKNLPNYQHSRGLLAEKEGYKTPLKPRWISVFLLPDTKRKPPEIYTREVTVLWRRRRVSKSHQNLYLFPIIFWLFSLNSQ